MPRKITISAVGPTDEATPPMASLQLSGRVLPRAVVGRVGFEPTTEGL